jgi:hypothetical protein
MLSSLTVQEILVHLGGLDRLKEIGLHNFVADESRISFSLPRGPRNVRSVTVAPQPHGRYVMECYGAIVPGTFKAPLIAQAGSILPENLATVLGQLTGVEGLRHHHF